jgi:hypothetical protein
VEPDEIAIAPRYSVAPQDAAPEAASEATPAHQGADADSIAALESELGAIESELHALDHDAH